MWIKCLAEGQKGQAFIGIKLQPFDPESGVQSNIAQLHNCQNCCIPGRLFMHFNIIIQLKLCKYGFTYTFYDKTDKIDAYSSILLHIKSKSTVKHG